MAMDFPASPSVGQIFTVDSKTWAWDGTSWNAIDRNTTFISHGGTHEVGGIDAIVIAQSQVTNLTTDIAGKATLSSPAFTGTPTAPTATAGTNTTQLATTAFVGTAIAAINALPSQSGQSGKFLGTNGSVASWQTVDALPSQTGNNGKTLTTDGTTASWTVPVSGATRSTIMFLGGM